MAQAEVPARDATAAQGRIFDVIQNQFLELARPHFDAIVERLVQGSAEKASAKFQVSIAFDEETGTYELKLHASSSAHGPPTVLNAKVAAGQLTLF